MKPPGQLSSGGIRDRAPTELAVRLGSARRRPSRPCELVNWRGPDLAGDLNDYSAFVYLQTLATMAKASLAPIHTGMKPQAGCTEVLAGDLANIAWRNCNADSETIRVNARPRVYRVFARLMMTIATGDRA